MNTLRPEDAAVRIQLSLRRRPLRLLVAGLLLAAALWVANASEGTRATAAGSLRLELVGKFRQPVHVTQPSAGAKIYVVERAGKVWALQGTQVLKRPFINLTRKVTSKDLSQGLLSIAFAPDFATSRLVYAYFTAKNGDQVVVELKSNAAATGIVRPFRTVLRMPDFNNAHNGGMLQFGPDGYLYISTGDGGFSPKGDPKRTALNRNSLLGKILRIDPRKSGSTPYTSPPSNPFVGTSGRDEVFSLGFRNPWRFSIEPSRGLIAIGDVGLEKFEEVNITTLANANGGNFGWSAYEGLVVRNADQLSLAQDRIDPVLGYSHSNGCSVTGGLFVRDPSLPSLLGRYLYADYCSRRLRSFVYDGLVGATGRRSENLKVDLVTSFGEGASGQVWVASLKGQVFRIRQQ